MATTKTQRIPLRATPEQRTKLVEASKAEGTSVTDFVLRHATRAAEDVLADRRVFVLPEERWTAFMDLLDAPPREIPELRKLFESPTVFESE